MNFLTKTSLFFLCILSMSLSSHCTEKKDGETKRIICLGDSLTAGFGLKKEQAYPALLQKELDASSEAWKVVNAGVSGNTSAGGLRRLNWYFSQKVDVLILALGANDGLRGLNIDKTYENLEKTIIRARDKYPDIRIIIAGMKVPPNMGEDYCTKFEALFPKLASKHKCELIPFLLKDVAGIVECNQADGIHPNSKGQQQVMKNVLNVLRPKE